MSKKRYRPPQEIFSLPSTESTLPTEQPIAIYYRQSTEAQVGNISTSMQTVDMVDYLKRCGWNDRHIIMIDMDEGISGSTKIDERPGMSQLFELIHYGEIGAVACQDEDRLFRDVTQIQVNIFIEACRASSVLVITPTMVYDFANPMTGVFHSRQFRFKSEMAAEYINTVIRGRLHTAKRRLQLEGRWAGGGIPAGFMVDMRKHLSNGVPNPQWRKYVPFEPFAKVVREYFQIFLENAGNVRATVRQIHNEGPYYPDLETCQPPKGFKIQYKLKRYGNGYCPGRTGLVTTLTNAAYIGHWAVNKIIVHWEHHQPIVAQDVFYQVFNYLSDTNLDGSKNTKYRPIQENRRPSKEQERPADPPLLSGMIRSYHDSKWCNVGTNWISPGKAGPGNHYSYTLWGNDVHSKYVWSKKAVYIDAEVVRLTQEKLLATFDQTVWEQTVGEFTKEYSKEKARLRAQASKLEAVMDNLISSLETLSNPSMIRATQHRFEQAEAEKMRLLNELDSMNNEAQRLQALIDLQSAYEPLVGNWDNLTRDEQRNILHMFIDHIEAHPVEKHGLHVKVCWRDNSYDEIVLARQSTTGVNWLPSQVDALVTLVESGASQIEIAQAFSTRNWMAIRNKMYRMFGKQGVPKFKPKLIRDKETFYDYLERVEEKSLVHVGSVDRSEITRRGEPD